MSPPGSKRDEPISNRLAVLRAERRELSRRDSAGAVGIHYQTVGYLERGEYSPRPALAFRIARFFDLPVEAVFSDRPADEFGRVRPWSSPVVTSHPAPASARDSSTSSLTLATHARPTAPRSRRGGAGDSIPAEAEEPPRSAHG